jgi:hypothetical protein
MGEEKSLIEIPLIRDIVIADLWLLKNHEVTIGLCECLYVEYREIAMLMTI